MKNKRRVITAVALLTVAGVLTGCTAKSGGSTSTSGTGVAPAYNAAASGIVNASTKTGGTLNLLADSDCDSWDPATTYYGWCWNMQRLFSRTLIGYSKVNGTTFTLAPDMATNMGTHNSANTEWTYTLQSGLKFSNGDPITADDIKYAVERMYSSSISAGSPDFYFTSIINAPASYKGPFNNGGDLPDSAVSVSGNSITFHLKKAFADFNYLMALPSTAPVEKSKDTGAAYTKAPESSGPFVFTNYTQNKSVTFTRNKYWKQSTDKIRHPLANEIDLTIDSSDSDIDAKLKAGTADAKANTIIGTTLQSQVLTNPKLKAYADDPAGASTSYLVVPASVVPNKYCREAIFDATNKAGLIQATGGTVAGTIAGSMTPPGILGYQTTSAYDPFPTGSDGTGDVTAAKAALSKCGKPNGFSTNFAYSTPSSTHGAVFQVEQKALARVGITITAKTAAASSYYTSFVGSPANVKSQQLGIIEAGWGADFPTPYGFYQNIANGAAIVPTGNSNYGSINDPTVNSILDNTAQPSTAATGEQLNHALMATAIDLPYAWGKYLYYRNPRMTNVTSNNAQAFGIYDFVNVGVGG